MTDAVDPLMAFLAENPPKDVFELRSVLDGFIEGVNGSLPEIGESIDDVVIRGFDGQDLTVDIHQPKGEGPFPILVYLHGGGWVLGSPKTHRKLGYRFAERGFVVFNVHYRLAPEAPFPAAFDDCETALDWVLENAGEYGGDVSRLALGGDSAGGNLTAAVASQAENRDAIKAALLIYPAMDFANMVSSDSHVPNSDLDFVGAMVGSYLGHDQDNLIKDPRVSPIHAAANLPEVLITCGTADGLMADCQALEAVLTECGKSFETDYHQDMPHGFCQLEDFFPQAMQSIETMAAFLDRKLSS